MTVASIDIGTNTILMLIASVSDDKITPLSNFHSIPRIGTGLTPGGLISNGKIHELKNILKDYKQIAFSHNCEDIIIIGTNALRIASNKTEIINNIQSSLGLNIYVIDGKKEAYLSFLGASSSASSERKIVIDIGGGSTEIITGGNKIDFSKSYSAGVVIGTEKYFIHDPPTANEIQEFEISLQNLFVDLPIYSQSFAIAIAGTPTTLACINQNLKVYDEDLVEGSSLSLDEIDKLLQMLKSKSVTEMSDHFGEVIKGRADVLLAGTILLHFIMQKLQIKQITVSTKGIRYGAIISKYLLKDANF